MGTVSSDELMIFGIVAALSGLIAALIVGGKGRSTVAYFAVGFFFPIVGILAAVLASPSAEAQVRKDIESGQKMNCPHCYSAIDSRATVCPHCQRALTAAQVTAGR